MRLEASLLVAGLALLLVAPGAGAHAPAVDAEASDEGPLPDPICVPVCEVQTTAAGNAPPVTVVEDGGSITWSVLSGSYHTATSDDATTDKQTLLVDGKGTTDDACLNLGTFTGDPGTAKFRIHEGDLQVNHTSREDPTWQTCEEAIGHPDGSFVLSYHCNVHPRSQNSLLVVVPSPPTGSV